MNEIVNELNIKNMIYEIKGKQVMLDIDLAKLYQCGNGTKDINKAAKRHLDRFPADFYFQLTKEEYYEILRFQSGTLELEHNAGTKTFAINKIEDSRILNLLLIELNTH